MIEPGIRRFRSQRLPQRQAISPHKAGSLEGHPIMHRRSLLALASSSLAFLTLGFTAARSEEYRVTGPIVHENLAIYLVRGKSASGPVPLTLEEALGKRTVKVHETGNVNELQIENLGADEVFVQSGDIV